MILYLINEEDRKIIKLLKGFIKQLSFKKTAPKVEIEPVVIPRNEHIISRKAINPNALKVLYRLHNAGFDAYLVGGCVRDLLFNYPPKDYDLATNARPEEIRKLFKNCRLIGKRFRLAHIIFGREIIEVATFRTHHEHAESQHHARTLHGMIVRDNVFGSIHDDAWRRDFTINALYYSIADFSVLDYVKGMEDIKTGTLRIIGHPEKRYQEDPVRLLRAVRIMAKLNLNINPETEEPIIRLSHSLNQVSPARLYQEVLKFFHEGALLKTFLLLEKYKLFSQLFPQTAESIQHNAIASQLIEQALKDTDERIKQGKTVSPAFLFAIFLWEPVKQQLKREKEEGFPIYVCYERAVFTVLKKQIDQLAITKQIQLAIRDIIFLQHRFTHRSGNRPFKLLSHPRFRAAHDLLLLRSTTDPELESLYQWWTQFSSADADAQTHMVKSITHSYKKGKKKLKSS